MSTAVKQNRTIERHFIDEKKPIKLEPGYIGSLKVRLVMWNVATLVAALRPLLCSITGARQVPKDNEVQYQRDLKGLVGEIVFAAYLARQARLQRVKVEFAPVLSITPVRSADAVFNGKRIDVKSVSTKIPDVHDREDHLFTINALKQREATSDFYACIIVHPTLVDVFIVARDEVNQWQKRKGATRAGSYYCTPIPEVAGGEAEAENGWLDKLHTFVMRARDSFA